MFSYPGYAKDNGRQESSGSIEKDFFIYDMGVRFQFKLDPMKLEFRHLFPTRARAREPPPNFNQKVFFIQVILFQSTFTLPLTAQSFHVGHIRP